MSGEPSGSHQAHRRLAVSAELSPGLRRPAPGWWGMVFAGLGNGAAFRWCDDGAPEWNRGQVGAKTWHERGTMLGAARVTLTAAAAPPESGDWRVGDVVLSSAPTSTLDGWRRCDDGNGPFWRPFVWSTPA